MFIGLGGLSQAVWLLLIFPLLQRRIGTGGVLRICASVWPIFFFLAAFGNYLLRVKMDAVFWVYAPTLLIIGSGVAMAFSTFFSLAL